MFNINNKNWKLRSKGVKLAIHETLVGDSWESDRKKYVLILKQQRRQRKTLTINKHQTSGRLQQITRRDSMHMTEYEQ